MVLTRRASRYFNNISLDTDLLDLPLYLIDKIVTYLDDVSLMRLKKVCKLLYDYLPMVKLKFKFPVAMQKSGLFPRRAYMKICCNYYYTSVRSKHVKIPGCILCDSKHFITYKCPKSVNTYVITCVNCNNFNCTDCNKELFFPNPKVCSSCDFNKECNIPTLKEVRILTDNYEIKYCKGNKFKLVKSDNFDILQGELKIIIGKYEIKYSKEGDHELVNILFQNLF
jgi:hypothetical protein